MRANLNNSCVQGFSGTSTQSRLGLRHQFKYLLYTKRYCRRWVACSNVTSSTSFHSGGSEERGRTAGGGAGGGGSTEGAEPFTLRRRRLRGGSATCCATCPSSTRSRGGASSAVDPSCMARRHRNCTKCQGLKNPRAHAATRADNMTTVHLQCFWGRREGKEWRGR